MVTPVKHGLRGVVWKKSSRSNPPVGANCVEVAFLPTGVAVGDTKDPDGPALTFGPKAWGNFLNGVQKGEFDL